MRGNELGVCAMQTTKLNSSTLHAYTYEVAAQEQEKALGNEQA